MVIGKRVTQDFVLRRETRKNTAKTLSDNDILSLQGYPDNNFGEPIWLSRIVTNMVNNKFQKQPLWEADKRIKLDVTRIDCGDIGLKNQLYEKVPIIVEWYQVYRL